MHVLWLLQHQGAMSMSRLAELLGRLAVERHRDHRPDGENQLIERVRVPDDRRLVLVQPAAAGRPRPLRDRERPSATRMRAVLGRLSASERRSSSRRCGACAGRSRPRSSRARPTATTSPTPPTSDRAPHRDTEGSACMESFPELTGRPAADARRSRRIPPSGCPGAPSSRSSARSCSACSCSALDQTIVGPVLPKIVSDLNGTDFYTWAVTIYLLTSTVTVPIYGKLSDLYGRKPILIFGIGLFLAGSALAGLSQEMWQLVALPRHPGPRRRRALPDRARGHRRPLHPGRARQVPGPLRPRVRQRVPARPGHRRRRSPTTSAGTRSSTSTCRSARSPSS